MEFGFVIVRVTPELERAVSEMQALAAEFFKLPRATRQKIGTLRLYRDKVVGYRELGGGAARFMEVHALAGGGVIPAARAVPGLPAASERLHTHLQAMARTIITWMAEHIGVSPTALLQCIDEPSLQNREDGDCGASVLRLSCYGSDMGCEEDSIVPLEGVVFDEHTDASYVTIAPVSVTPGLQMRHPETDEWLDVECGLDGCGGDLVVFIGDFVEVLTKRTYAAARHRVIATPEVDHQLAHRRLSMPFLVRGQPDATIDTTEFVVEESDEVPLARLNMNYAMLRRFLDLKGRKRFKGERLLQGSPGDAVGDASEGQEAAGPGRAAGKA